jgi:molecular chaperone DnaK
MLADKEKKYREGAVLLREILDEKPDAARVRLELARLQAEMGNRAAAERELRAAEAAGLPPEVERMVQEAERHAGEDRRRREEIDARNELDSLAYRAEQLIGELSDGLPVHEKARAEQLVADARQAIEEQAGLDRVRPLAADLQQLVHGLPSAASATTHAKGDGDSHEPADDEEVVDAEFTRK